MIRRGTGADVPAISAIINDAAQAYRNVIPADRWHEPYMPDEELAAEIAAGVVFWVVEEDDQVLGVMGIQDKSDVALVRHAYTSSSAQRRGIGTQLLRHLESQVDKPVLIGTWADATWAIDFYLRNGFTLLPAADKDRLLRIYWSIPERQAETSVVLADRRWMQENMKMPKASAVLFVANVMKMTEFYRALASMTLVSADDQHAVLEVEGFQLVVHALRGAPEVTSPSVAREDSYVKVCFPVESIAAARVRAASLGGSIKPARYEFEARDFRACDGHDPEGNVLQVRESLRR